MIKFYLARFRCLALPAFQSKSVNNEGLAVQLSSWQPNKSKRLACFSSRSSSLFLSRPFHLTKEKRRNFFRSLISKEAYFLTDWKPAPVHSFILGRSVGGWLVALDRQCFWFFQARGQKNTPYVLYQGKKEGRKEGRKVLRSSFDIQTQCLFSAASVMFVCVNIVYIVCLWMCVYVHEASETVAFSLLSFFSSIWCLQQCNAMLLFIRNKPIDLYSPNVVVSVLYYYTRASSSSLTEVCSLGLLMYMRILGTN